MRPRKFRLRRVIGLAREDVAVEPLGLAQFAGLMMPHRLRKHRSEFGRASPVCAQVGSRLFLGGPPVAAIHVGWDFPDDY